MEKKDEILDFYYIGKSLIITFHVNNDHDLSWNEKFALNE
jgi:hypothetical protein